ncbi:hypothetical protein HY993_04430 [Candidatus Micrarchaeota archaeon]|nr:hypothetical protein [Candidatus Micrarchaeota archaeon]
MRKGQSYALDLGASLVLFVVLLGLFEIYWAQTITQDDPITQLRLEANRISQQLSEQPGIPANWNQSSPGYVGLASERLVIDPAKLASLVSLGSNYSQLKDLLGVRYEFLLALNYFNSAAVNTTSGPAAIGLAPQFDSLAISQQTQTIYEGNRTVLYVVAWR